MVLFS